MRVAFSDRVSSDSFSRGGHFWLLLQILVQFREVFSDLHMLRHPFLNLYFRFHYILILLKPLRLQRVPQLFSELLAPPHRDILRIVVEHKILINNLVRVAGHNSERYLPYLPAEKHLVVVRVKLFQV